MSLKLDWATHEAAKFACTNWHYSTSIPKSKLVKIGVWEFSRFIGVMIFSPGATPQIGSPYNLKQTEICELTRIALTKHVAPVSRIMAIGIKFLRRHCPGLRLIVSYADLEQGHAGGIYQATNWIYAGQTKPDCYIKVLGVIEHRKSIYDRYGCQSLEWLKKNIDPDATRIPDLGKHKYLMPLDGAMRSQIGPSKPYPKKCASSKVSVAITDQVVEGGAIPTDALHSKEKVLNG